VCNFSYNTFRHHATARACPIIQAFPTRGIDNIIVHIIYARGFGADAGLHHAREMLEFMIFAFTVVVGLLVILVFCWFGERSSTSKVREDIFSSSDVATALPTIKSCSYPPNTCPGGLCTSKYTMLTQFVNSRVSVSLIRVCMRMIR